MGAGDLAPDHADLGAADLAGCAVDVGDLLAKVEAAEDSQFRQSRYSSSGSKTYLAALVSSTPSILMRLVPG